MSETESLNKDLTPVEWLQIVARAPFNKRGTIRSTAVTLSIPKSPIYRNSHSNKIRRHRNAVKPSLTLANMGEREEFYNANLKDEKTIFSLLIKSGFI